MGSSHHFYMYNAGIQELLCTMWTSTTLPRFARGAIPEACGERMLGTRGDHSTMCKGVRTPYVELSGTVTSTQLATSWLLSGAVAHQVVAWVICVESMAD